MGSSRGGKIGCVRVVNNLAFLAWVSLDVKKAYHNQAYKPDNDKNRTEFENTATCFPASWWMDVGLELCPLTGGLIVLTIVRCDHKASRVCLNFGVEPRHSQSVTEQNNKSTKEEDFSLVFTC